MSFTVIHLAPGEAVLVLSIHHLLCDHWSVTLLVREMLALESAGRQGLPARLPRPATHPADHPGDNPSTPSRTTSPPARVRSQCLGVQDDRRGLRALDRALPADLTRAVRELAIERNATTASVFLAAYSVVLARRTGSASVEVEIPTMDRRQRARWTSVGHYCRYITVPITTGPIAFGDLLAAVHASMLEAQENRGETAGAGGPGFSIRQTPASADPEGVEVRPVRWVAMEDVAWPVDYSVWLEVVDQYTDIGFRAFLPVRDHCRAALARFADEMVSTLYLCLSRVDDPLPQIEGNAPIPCSSCL